MEGIIIMVVIALLSRFLSGNGEGKQKKRETPAMPPFSNDKPQATYIEPKPVEETRPRRPKMEVKSLEDFTQEVFGQLQQKAEKREIEPIPAVVEPTPAPPVQTTRPAFMDRAELGEGRKILQNEKKKQRQSTVKIPKTREDLVQAVIMAEVLGQPKARQPRRSV